MLAPLFFAGRTTRRDLLRWLKRGDVRLLLPADPGPEQMLEYVRLFDLRAKLLTGTTTAPESVMRRRS